MNAKEKPSDVIGIHHLGTQMNNSTLLKRSIFFASFAPLR